MTVAEALRAIADPTTPDADYVDAVDVVVERLTAAEAELAHHRATVTTGGPPPRYHLPGEWRAPDHTPPPDSAHHGPPTPTRKDPR